MEKLAERHETFYFSSLNERKELAKKVLDAFLKDAWSYRGDWVKKSCKLEKSDPERIEDIALLTDYFIENICKANNYKLFSIKDNNYLLNYDWKPIIVTPENPYIELKDSELEKEVSDKIEIIKLPIWEPYSLKDMFFGDKENNIQPLMTHYFVEEG